MKPGNRLTVSTVLILTTDTLKDKKMLSRKPLLIF